MCHCLACQKRTGSAFGIQARWPSDRVTIEGSAQDYARIGPLVPGVDFPVAWNPATSSNLPPTTQLVGGGVIGVVWLLDAPGAPTHMCLVSHSNGQFTIPGSAITEYRQIAQARGLETKHVILQRSALVHQLARLPNGEPTKQRRIDMLALVSWLQLMDVQ
jgi:hypothetical protein